MPKLLDQDNIRDQIHALPTQIHQGYAEKLTLKPFRKKFTNYVICGMGGSSLVDELLRNTLESGVPIYTSRDYHLPREVNSGSLIVIVSYSGNTEESLFCYHEARRRSLPCIVMASGGKLQALTQRHKTPFIPLPKEGISQPRYSTGFQYAYHIRIMEMHKLIPSQKSMIDRSCAEAKMFESEKDGKSLARRLKDRVAVWYVPSDYASVGRIATIKFAENAKVISHYNVVPELNHNEMNGLVFAKKQADFVFFLITSRDVHPRAQKRFVVMRSLLRKAGLTTIERELQGTTRLSRVISGIMLADWISFYLAQLNGIDPSPVDIVETFKKLLG